METTTQATKSLLEIWNDAEKKKCSPEMPSLALVGGVYFQEREELKHKLEVLLESELIHNTRGERSIKLCANEDTVLLEEYRSDFEWDIEYQLEVTWEIATNYVRQELADFPLEDLSAVLRGDLELECPDWEEIELDIYWGDYLTGDNNPRPNIVVSNLRPKGKSTSMRFHC